MQKFASKLRHDIDAVHNTIRESWSNGQTEGQINRLKMLKRAMYGRASVASLCARMRPLREVEYHQIRAGAVYYQTENQAKQRLWLPVIPDPSR